MKGCLKWTGIGFGGLMVLGMVSSLFGCGGASMPATPTVIALPATPAPTSAPRPTQTPRATSAPRPTATARPAAPTSAPTTAPAAQPAPAATRGPIPTAIDVGAAPCQPGQIKANRNSKIYHAPGQRDYGRTQANVQCFDSAADAQAAGYRAAER